MQRHNLEFDMILRGIVMTRGELGATIKEMRSDYYDIIGEAWPLKYRNTHEIIIYLLEIDGLMMEKLDTGLCIWYIDDIGCNISERDLDANNNDVIVIDGSSVLENEDLPHNNSYAIPAPRRHMVTSSFVNEHARGMSTVTSASDTSLMESIESINRKRNLSPDSQSVSIIDKRPKLLAPDRLPLLEKNLDIHNRKNGAKVMVKKQTTSTEIENSMSVQSDLNACIVTNEYITPINALDNKQLQHAFEKRCRIKEKPSIIQTESANSTISEEETLFANDIGVIGDDFMRSLISFELYGGDFTDENDKNYGFCISGLTVRDAYHLVLDKQHHLRSKYRYLILNVGAMDILMERDFFDIVADYTRLVKAVEIIGLQPIMTTLPNVWTRVDYANHKIIYQSLLLFNQFLLSTYRDGYMLIDLHESLTEPNNKYTCKYFHKQPKTITKGISKLELFRWTENGRKKIINMIYKFTTNLPI